MRITFAEIKNAKKFIAIFIISLVLTSFGLLLASADYGGSVNLTPAINLTPVSAALVQKQSGGATEFECVNQGGSWQNGNCTYDAEFAYQTPVLTAASFADSNQPPKMEGLYPDKQSPQESGVTVIWTATASDAENDPLYYRFLLKGPRTENEWQMVQDWSRSSTWPWNIQDSDVGSSSVRILIRDGKHAGSGDLDSFEEYNDYQIIPKQLTQLNIQVTNDVYSENDRHLYYCQDGKYLEFRNRIYLIGPDLDKIRSVKYVLHESFQDNPAPSSEDRSNNFEIWIMTWGRFHIKALITTTTDQQFEKDYDFAFKSKVEEAQRMGIPMIMSCEG